MVTKADRKSKLCLKTQLRLFCPEFTTYNRFFGSPLADWGSSRLESVSISIHSSWAGVPTLFALVTTCLLTDVPEAKSCVTNAGLSVGVKGQSISLTSPAIECRCMMWHYSVRGTLCDSEGGRTVPRGINDIPQKPHSVFMRPPFWP